MGGRERGSKGGREGGPRKRRSPVSVTWRPEEDLEDLPLYFRDPTVRERPGLFRRVVPLFRISTNRFQSHRSLLQFVGQGPKIWVN